MLKTWRFALHFAFAYNMSKTGAGQSGYPDFPDNPDDPDYSINGEKYYEVVFFDFIWDADRHGIESMNSDMILAITAEYMKKYPDAIFYCEANLLDKTDIDTLMLQPFQPDWFRFFKSHKFCHGYESRNGWIFA